jgi:hypothetical protein
VHARGEVTRLSDGWFLTQEAIGFNAENAGRDAGA